MEPIKPPRITAWLNKQPANGWESAKSCEVAMHDWHAEVAEYRLRHDGIKPELALYLYGIGEAFR